ncbi:aminopeptidase P family protein [Aestuariispira insulae]|uniref:Xaa-Pro aminopeptidase n=1 Tax=Aestuariispira insulae TaxID=1461337 RepID=A0A3D9HSS7_9PROT|nr:aminopeptidase P family protein [Aestuariispira insulae]RED52554.1 Xaa-Pro aminopeptidase [Aestuariispira insulae]
MSEPQHPDSITGTRLAALRAELSARQLSGFVIPRFDAHQGEYIAPHDERLAWLTGFTGSAGLAIVTMEKAVLFIDGRYTVQAADECDPDWIRFRHLQEAPPENWIAENLQTGDRLGFDPMLIPPAWQKRFLNASDSVSAHLIAVEGNPVDAVWKDQPRRPQGSIFPLSPEQTGNSVAAKASLIAGKLRDKGVDLLVETQPDNIGWLLNLRGSDADYIPVPHSFLLLDSDGALEWFVDPAKLPQDRSGFELTEVDMRGPDLFLPRLAERSASSHRVWIDPDYSPYAAEMAVHHAGGEILSERNPITMQKAVKNEAELAGMRRTHLEDAIAWCEFLAELNDLVTRGINVTERQAEAMIERQRKERPGYLNPSFHTISASGPHGALCHYAATRESDRVLSLDEIYLVDSGGQYADGTTDATRTFYFGSNPAAEYAKLYTLVLKGFIALSTLRFPKGTQGHHIDAVARRPLWEHGLDYDHGTGHGVGHCLSVHEQPQRIGKPHNPVDLRPGMVVTIEPGYYRGGAFGIRIENEVEIVQEMDGFMAFRPLTLIPIQSRLIDWSLLDLAEIRWLNRYHANVRDALAGKLSVRASAWLAKETAPKG